MSQTNTFLNEIWTTLANALDQIFQFRSMTSDAFMTLYNTVAKYLRSPEYNDNLLKSSSNKPKPKPTNESDKTVDQIDTNEFEKNLPGGELYFNIKKFFKAYLENIAANGNNLQGEDFLRFYAKTWEKYQFSSKVANGILAMVNDTWVTRQQKDGLKGIYDIYTMSMHIWQDIFFKESNQSLTQTCLNLINEERNGQHIDSLLIRQVVQSYASAGFIKSEKSNTDHRNLWQSLVTYVDYFEKQFLQETEQFYNLESNNYIENNSINDYVKKVYQRLQEEEGRVKDYLHPTTLEKLKPLLDRILIKGQLEPMYIESQRLLRDDKIEDLRLLFELVNRIEKANEPIQKDLEEYAYKFGMDAISRISSTAINDPKIYVETIIDTTQKFFTIVKKGFCGQQGYLVALDKAFSKLINNNTVTQEARKSTKSPELLARYCDIILRKGNKAEESDVEEKINQIMVVFNYVEDKDVFQKFYGKLLAKRLVGQLSASDDYEGLMISKLKEACGFEYAIKLQRMFQDIGLSANLIVEYKTYRQNRKLDDSVDFSVMVLTSNSWPFSAPPTFNLSIELKNTSQSFFNFYSNKFHGRKLEWLHQHSKGEIQTLYTKPKYTLQTSTYQITVLLLFNEFESLTVEKILDMTQIEGELFRQVLLGLLKSKVLSCLQINVDELNESFKESDIKLNYTIQVDETFKSKKIKINLNQPIKSIEQKESENVNQSVEDDRKILIQAAVVRIMKARKALKHNLLIQEVIPQLTSRFKPQVPMIKRCIDILIEKEYLERDAKEKDLFRYLA